MSLISRMRKQTAVYWPSPVSDGRGGYTYGDAVEIVVRWEDIHEVFLSVDGEEVVSNARVYVDRVVDELGFLFLGELTDLDSSALADPMLADGAFSIRKFEVLPNLRNTENLYTVML